MEFNQVLSNATDKQELQDSLSEYQAFFKDLEKHGNPELSLAQAKLLFVGANDAYISTKNHEKLIRAFAESDDESNSEITKFMRNVDASLKLVIDDINRFRSSML